MEQKMIDKRLSVHHIGGRYGNRPFPFLKKFKKDIVSVFYDADPDCLEQIKEKNQGLESELHVLPYCLADVCKTTHLNINYDPYTSSLLEPNPDYRAYYYFNIDHDYVLKDVTEVMEKRRIETVTMDYIFQSTNIQIPPPDFLSIDTQGSEYEILVGAKETLKSSVIALVVEAEFHPIYKGQKLFGELTHLLSEQGFDFVRFLGIQGMSPFRAPVGLRGEDVHVSAEALFFRRLNNMDNSQGEVRCYAMLRKLAFISIIFNQFEYGLECLRRSRSMVNHNSAVISEKEPVYLEFLRDLEQSAENMPVVFPDRFVSRYASFTASKARFTVAKTGVVNKIPMHIKIKQVLKRIPVLNFVLRQIKQVLHKGSLTVAGFFVYKGCPVLTRVENLLVRYGLESQADVLRKNRLVQTRLLRK